MPLPNPYIHPDDTGSHTFWTEDGVWWNADVVNGGTLDLRVYGRQYQTGGSQIIQWVIDTREDELGSLETLLLEQAGEDGTTARTISLQQATEMSQKGNGKHHGNGNGHAKHAGQEHRDGRGALGGSEDPIKSIKGMGENRANDLSSCLQGNPTSCSTDLTSTYPRDPA